LLQEFIPMKKIVILISLSCFFFKLSAQEKNADKRSELMPSKGDYGVMLVLDGLIDQIDLSAQRNQYGNNLLFGRYYLEDKLVLRAGFGVGVSSRTRSTADSVGTSLVEVDSSRNNYMINLSGGVEAHLGNSKRLDPYFFSQIDLTFIGKTNTSIDRREISGAGTASRERTIKEDGGLAIGLVNGMGLNYFVANRLSIGTEISFNLLYVNRGGTISDNEIITPINGAATSNFSRREDQQAQFNLDVQPSATINFSYFF